MSATQSNFDGEYYVDNDTALLWAYATDASVYQEKPKAVAIPKSIDDLKKLILLAEIQHTTLIPRAAGTSLAGQVVGNGIVVDISKYFTEILELNTSQKWVKVQPGVIRNDLNAYLKPHGLLFGPETSTASRAMIGGMIGNNSSGLHSIIWGDTRTNLMEVKALLSDGSEVIFGEITQEQLAQKLQKQDNEGKIYQQIFSILNNPQSVADIMEGFPKPEITRRNTGYALDILLAEHTKLQNGGTFNLAKLIAGSEGTLCIITEAKLQLIDLPPPFVGLVCVHCSSFIESTQANLVALKHHCSASELIDELSLTLTEGSTDLSNYRSFVNGKPKAILMVEFHADTEKNLYQKAASFVADLKKYNIGYDYPLLQGDDCNNAWELRKASLGILSNQKGDIQPINLIEDCAVTPQDLPNYIADIEALLSKYNLDYSITAHAGAGELHVLPMMNVRTSAGKKLFRTILAETIPILKKYKGSLSGEHGDGRLRGEFIPATMGPACYQLFVKVKHIFDPNNIFNKGKITDTPAMNTFMRVDREHTATPPKTIFDFEHQEGILRLAEKCSGSGDCRKTHISGGTMCPSYMATRAEKDTTRARANLLRQYYSPENEPNQWAEPTKEVLDLCLSCKGCKSECPSSVDVGKMKAEFTQGYYDQKGAPFRSKLIANFSKIMQWASTLPWVYNGVFTHNFLRKTANKLVGFHPDRSMPHLATTTFRSWWQKNKNQYEVSNPLQKVYLFVDEFTNYNDVPIAQDFIKLLHKLNYQAIIIKHADSARSQLSKGFVREAQKLAIDNVTIFKDIITENSPLIGIEPSAILGFRDEYPDLVGSTLRPAADNLAKNVYLFEEWFTKEIEKGHIKKEQFTAKKQLIKLHGHCHQKALSSMIPAKKALSIPQNYEVQLIHSGCCGMAGSFGYEAEHYDISMKIGELVLFPTVRQQPDNVIIAAPGTSCRHQILDGTTVVAQHPIQILYKAIN